MNVMRVILSREMPSLPLYRMLNQDVIEQFAELLRRRVWHVHEQPIPAAKPRGEPENIPVDPDPGGNVPVPSEPDNNDVLNDLDEAAIAAALALAALLGIPLVEECTNA